jgi:hypothetical protein
MPAANVYDPRTIDSDDLLALFKKWKNLGVRVSVVFSSSSMRAQIDGVVSVTGSGIAVVSDGCGSIDQTMRDCRPSIAPSTGTTPEHIVSEFEFGTRTPRQSKVRHRDAEYHID